MRLVAVLVACVLLTSLTLGLSIAAFVVARSAAPLTATIPPMPAVVPTGDLCTYPAARFETLNTTCFPTAFNDTATYDYCRARRNASDVACVIAACTSYVAQVYPLSTTNSTPYRSLLVLDYRLDLFNPDVWDLGPVRIAQVLQQFVLDNRPDAIVPDIVPAPRPLGANGLFSVADVGLVSFRRDGRELARQFMVFYWNYLANQRRELSTTNHDLVVRNSVVTATRCPFANVASIPWLQSNNVTVRELFAIGFYMMSMPNYVPFTEEEWTSFCSPRMSAFYCALFPSYYTIESVTNFTVVPSPYRDLTSVFTAYNEEYVNCGPARGCFGYAH